METALELKSSSHRALIPLLKKLNFIDSGNVPTEIYKNFRDKSMRGKVMADQVRNAYSDLYRAHEYAHQLKKDELLSKLRAVTGAAEDDPYLPAVVGTFTELIKAADFEATSTKANGLENTDSDKEKKGTNTGGGSRPPNLGLSYTINLNLPATTDIEVFNAIFKSLKEHLIDE